MWEDLAADLAAAKVASLLWGIDAVKVRSCTRPIRHCRLGNNRRSVPMGLVLLLVYDIIHLGLVQSQ